MASCCRRYRARRLKALGHDPQLLVIRPAPPATSLDHLKPFKLSTALMAVHKDCYAPIGLIQQGGPRRRETAYLAVGPFLPPLQDVRPLLLGGVSGLFLSVIFRRWKKRDNAETLKACPSDASDAFNSSNVLSGLAAVSARMRSA